MDGSTLPPPGLSPVKGKRVEVIFDGGWLSSDGGVLAQNEVEKQLGVADRLVDPRNGAPVMKRCKKRHPHACAPAEPACFRPIRTDPVRHAGEAALVQPSNAMRLTTLFWAEGRRHAFFGMQFDLLR